MKALCAPCTLAIHVSCVVAAGKGSCVHQGGTAGRCGGQRCSHALLQQQLHWQQPQDGRPRHAQHHQQGQHPFFFFLRSLVRLEFELVGRSDTVGCGSSVVTCCMSVSVLVRLPALSCLLHSLARSRCSAAVSRKTACTACTA